MQSLFISSMYPCDWFCGPGLSEWHR